MKLTFDQIKACLTGIVRVEEKNGALIPRRLTEEQEKVYSTGDAAVYNKVFCAAGVRLWFKTNSKTLFLKAFINERSSRKFYSFDVFADGKPVGNIDNFSNVELPEDYVCFPLKNGECSGTVDLGEGEKTVSVAFPYNSEVSIMEVALDNGAYAEPFKPAKKLLAYGDSITQGFDALHPSMRYIYRVADALGAEEICKGIGGARFSPEYAALKDDIEPDYITVAYGTNDWSGLKRDVAEERCKGFFDALCKNYPGVPVFAITPLWRKDRNDPPRAFGCFDDVEKMIRKYTEPYPQIKVITGIDLIPHSPDNFGDFRLHPNDKGFNSYYENLISEIKKYL